MKFFESFMELKFDSPMNFFKSSVNCFLLGPFRLVNEISKKIIFLGGKDIERLSFLASVVGIGITAVMSFVGLLQGGFSLFTGRMPCILMIIGVIIEVIFYCFLDKAKDSLFDELKQIQLNSNAKPIKFNSVSFNNQEFKFPDVDTMDDEDTDNHNNENKEIDINELDVSTLGFLNQSAEADSSTIDFGDSDFDDGDELESPPNDSKGPSLLDRLRDSIEPALPSEKTVTVTELSPSVAEEFEEASGVINASVDYTPPVNEELIGNTNVKKFKNKVQDKLANSQLEQTPSVQFNNEELASMQNRFNDVSGYFASGDIQAFKAASVIDEANHISKPIRRESLNDIEQFALFT